MITTSSKLFYGLGTGALVAAIVWFIANDGGSIGAVALLFASISLVFLGAIASFTRDGHVLSTDTASHPTSGAAQRGVRNSLWPLGTAIATGFVVVGLISSPGIFKVGIGLLIAMLGEWMIQNWSERGSGDAEYNTKIRNYVVHPLELPVGGALLLAVVVLSFSRIMLSLSHEAGPLVFAVAGAAILAFGTLVGFRRSASPRVIGGICVVALTALAGVGVATALDGERAELTKAAEEDHFAHRPCGDEEEEADEDASRSVGAKSSVQATIILEDGVLSAEVDGFEGPQQSITLQRSNPSTIVFINRDDAAHRMVVKYGKVVEDLGGGVERETHLEACTSKVEKDGQQSVTLTVPKPSIASDEPYVITVPGVEGTKIDVVVP
ncbi:MAG: hypothetical protein RL391_770 [Actinomycetota bacterium]|jgi:hypothetical protein